ncbi:fibronectin type III domain-containing protein [Flavobacterium sp. NKUCC04_CG]|uniref:fibronectin type III domain-containing protein n=1 Tax=Flavobacterium sp. NKUCC04_CG TaxID=2842121 RepID=UPI001C5AA2AD|nr:fibronectin type III domain-containing protein [Flavobacterium sp. NKUCC04_CG]MBW3520008.1 fibronectin type III domain-containing protein [Flavobacterium sp. NKUCC04_CG]
MKKHFHFFFSLFLLVQTTVWAQLYPVQLLPNINTPYTNKISDFSNSSAERISLQVIPTDLTVVNRPVVLKLYFEGNGIAAQSASVLQGIPPMYINGGEILNLTSMDLAPYFQLKNIHGLNQNTYSQNLPDGMYQICFELYDGATRKLLSQKHCGMMYLMLNDPPLLNIPAQNEQIAQTDFTNILFSWTPRQLNAINISYTFELKELMDASMNANYAFDMAPLLYREEGVRTTVFLYDLFKPSLLPNKRYAWRVRAISHNGLAENSVFKNNGYSEVFTFKIDVNCEAPKAILAQPQGTNSVKISWQGVPMHLKYHLQYRKAQVENAAWFDLYSVNNQATISNLEAGYHYEFRVGGTCESVQYGQEPSYNYSNIQQFQLDNTAANSNFSCGLLPDINLINKAILSNLIVTETFYAGDFPVKVLELNGDGGVYTGKGYIIVPYLADTKIAVTFENIQINTDYQLISGQLETTYDPDWKNVSDMEDLTGSGADGKIDKEIPFPIDSIVIDNNGDIIIKGPHGEEVILPGGKDIIIIDSEGNIWKIGEDVQPGDQITEPNGSLSTDGKPSPGNTNGVDKNGQAIDFTAQGIRFAFENGPKAIYGWDAVSEKGATAKLKKEYREVKGQYLPYKAVAKGATDLVFAKAILTDGASIHTDSLEFKTDLGERIPFEVTTGGYLLKVKGSLNYAEEEILATVKQNGKSQLAGAFRLVHITPKSIQLSLVPTTAKVKTQLEGQIKALQAIYTPLAITLNIRIEEVFDVDSDQLKSEDKRYLTTYTKAQEAVINSYKGRASSDRYYLFVTGDQISDLSQQGYMRLQGQFGFVFNDQTRTLAHELAHGALALTHPFTTYNTVVGSLNTLMDYSTGTDFTHMDWKQVNDPKFKLYLFQGQSEGEFSRGYAISPDYKIFAVNSSILVDNIDYTSNPNLKNDGTLPGFQIGKKYYYWIYERKSYVAKIADGEEDVYQLNQLTVQSLDSQKVIHLFFDKERGCGKTSYKMVAAKSLKEYTKGIEEFIFSNDNDKIFLGCLSTTSSTNPNEQVRFVKTEEDVDKEYVNKCTGFVYNKKYSPVDKDLVKQKLLSAFNSRLALTSKERRLNERVHIQIVGDGKSNNEIELLEDKLHLLSYHKPNVFVSIVFIKKDIKSFYTSSALKELALDVLVETKNQFQGKKVLLIIIPYGNQLEIDNTCLRVGFAQTKNNDVVNYSAVNLSDDKTWFKNVLSIYSEIAKPLYISRYYKLADGKFIQRRDNSASDVVGYPFINTLNFYESKGYDEIKALNEKWSKVYRFNDNWTLYQKYLKEAKQIYFDFTSQEELEGSLNNASLWKEISNDDLGKYREIYMDDESLTNRLWIESKQQWAWGNKVEIALDLSNATIKLETKHFYNFDKLLLLDDVVYGVVDGIGLIPGVDTFTDPIGAVYAGVRSDYTNATIYSLSFSVPLVGSAYLKGALKTGEDASKLFGIVAKKADNTEGFVLDLKRISDININEVHVSSAYFGGDQKLTQKVLDEIRQEAKYLDGNFIRKELSLKTLGNANVLDVVKQTLLSKGLSKKQLKRLDNKELWTDDKLANLNNYLSNPNKYGDVASELKNVKLFDAVEAIIDNPGNAWDVIKETADNALIKAVTARIGRSQFFKEVIGKGNDFEKLVSSQIHHINPPFKDLLEDGYEKLSQIHLLRTGGSKKLIADDLFVKELFDETEGLYYYRAVISDSKLNVGSPWTPNQRTELIDIFAKDETKKFIEYEVRSNSEFLGRLANDADFLQSKKVRIYREDVYKIISEGDQIKTPPIKLNSNNFK